MEFLLGCNYWASNAGVDMWRNFSPEAIEKDLKTLSSHGVRYMRVFPLWRDFQPVKPNFGGSGSIRQFVMEDGSKPQNPYFLDEKMLHRFSQFMDICDKYNIKLVVGIITGWMSGGLFVPSALYNKNIIEDHTAFYFEQLFIKGFVEKFKERETIYAWDLGNECNCSGNIQNSFSAASWTAMISNAIKAADPTRAVVSGLQTTNLVDRWKLQDQGMFTDIPTTHPYPYWSTLGVVDETLSFRTNLYATALTKMVADITGKPSFAEEIGTMGPMVCDDKNSADYLRYNLFSLWANGSIGAMWWCNSDQNLLKTFPYTEQMVEQELGLMNDKGKPKPVLKEMQKFAEFLETTQIDLPKAQEQAVCLLTRGQDHVAVAYTTYVLAKSVGLNIKFCYAAEQEIPDAKLYLMPSATGQNPFSHETYEKIKEKVNGGADLYISSGKIILEGFEKFVGIKVKDSCALEKAKTVILDREKFDLWFGVKRDYEATTAKVLASDEDGNPAITVNKYGKGRVFFVDAPIEANMAKKYDAFSGKNDLIYKAVLKDHIDALPVSVDAKDVLCTIHSDAKGTYFVATNNSPEAKELKLNLKGNFEIEKVLYGEENTIKAFDACVLKLKSK